MASSTQVDTAQTKRIPASSYILRIFNAPNGFPSLPVLKEPPALWVHRTQQQTAFFFFFFFYNEKQLTDAKLDTCPYYGLNNVWVWSALSVWSVQVLPPMSPLHVFCAPSPRGRNPSCEGRWCENQLAGEEEVSFTTPWEKNKTKQEHFTCLQHVDCNSASEWNTTWETCSVVKSGFGGAARSAEHVTESGEE